MRHFTMLECNMNLDDCITHWTNERDAHDTACAILRAQGVEPETKRHPRSVIVGALGEAPGTSVFLIKQVS